MFSKRTKIRLLKSDVMIVSLLFSEDVEWLDIFTGDIEDLPANES